MGRGGAHEFGLTEQKKARRASLHTLSAADCQHTTSPPTPVHTERVRVRAWVAPMRPAWSLRRVIGGPTRALGGGGWPAPHSGQPSPIQHASHTRPHSLALLAVLLLLAASLAALVQRVAGNAWRERKRESSGEGSARVHWPLCTRVPPRSRPPSTRAGGGACGDVAGGRREGRVEARAALRRPPSRSRLARAAAALSLQPRDPSQRRQPRARSNLRTPGGGERGAGARGGDGGRATVARAAGRDRGDVAPALRAPAPAHGAAVPNH